MNEAANNDYIFMGASVPYQNIQLLDTYAFDKLLNFIKISISCNSIIVKIYEKQIRKLKVRVSIDNNEVAEVKELKKTAIEYE